MSYVYAVVLDGQAFDLSADEVIPWAREVAERHGQLDVLDAALDPTAPTATNRVHALLIGAHLGVWDYLYVRRETP